MDDLPLRVHGLRCRLDVAVTPRASRERIGPVVSGRLKIALTAPPVDGEANRALSACLARALGIAKSQVTIARGESGRRKTVEIGGLDGDELRRRLEALLVG